MTQLDFYFDPACPWAWLTSLWVREVREQRPLDIQWKFFSLAQVNEMEPERNGALRILAQARREGGNDAVDQGYLALGRAFHEERNRPENQEQLASIARNALQEAGLDPNLVQRALSDESTLEEVLREHNEAVEKYDAFGVPWIVLQDGTKGFFGPVIGERLRGQQALNLWEHFVWSSAQPYLYELKRGRAKLPDLKGLSAEFGKRAAVAGD